MVNLDDIESFEIVNKLDSIDNQTRPSLKIEKCFIKQMIIKDNHEPNFIRIEYRLSPINEEVNPIIDFYKHLIFSKIKCKLKDNKELILNNFLTKKDNYKMIGEEVHYNIDLCYTGMSITNLNEDLNK